MKALKVAFQDINKAMRFDGSYHLSEGTIYLKKLRKMPHKELDDLTSEIFTAGRSKRIYTEEKFGYPYLSNSDVVKQNPLNGCKYNSKKYGYDEPSFLKEGMIVTGRVGAIGQTAYITSEFEENKAMGSDNIIRIVPQDINKSGYIYSFLTSKYGKTLLWKLAAGGVQPYISEAMLSDMPIPMLSENIQQQIHNLIVEASDLRVEANKLLKKVHSIFDSKLTYNNDVEIVSSKKIDLVNSNYHKRLDSSYYLNISNVEKELLKDKYESVPLGELVKRKMFTAQRGKRNYVGSNGIRFLSTTNVSDVNPLLIEKYLSRNTLGLDTLLVKKNWILVSSSGQDILGSAFLVDNSYAECAVNQHSIRVIVDEKRISSYYVYGYLSTPKIKKYIRSGIYGSAVLTIDEHFLKDLKVPILKDVMNQIVKMVESYSKNFERACFIEKQAINLIENEIEQWQES